MVKYRKPPQKALIKEKYAFWQIAKMVKYGKPSPKALIKGKGALWEIVKMVKCNETSPKTLIKGKVPFGSRARKSFGIFFLKRFL